jgi:hypothetical protein
MKFEEFLQHMREALTPRNPDWPNNKDYDIVKMGIHSNHGYMDGETVRKAIDCFEKRSVTAFALGEQLNDLEALGAILLIESAHLMKEAKE